MDDVMPFLAILLGLVILATPIGALALALAARRGVVELRARHLQLEARLQHAEWWVGELVRRAAEVAASASATAATPSPAERSANAQPAVVAEPAPAAQPALALAPEPAAQPAVVAEPAPAAQPALALAPEPGMKPPPVAGGLPRPAASFDIEKVVGVRLFAWLGGLGLFAGVAFFLQYSIEHALLPPAVRVGVGLLLGSAALLLGDVLRPRGDRAGQAIAGAGVAILYASLFAAHGLYHLVGSSTAFAGMGVVTLVAGVMATRRRAFVLAVVSLVGGFATPVLLSSGEDHTLALFAYLTLLDVGVLAVASSCGWPSLAALGLIASAVMYAGWAAEYLDAHTPALALGAALLIASLFIVAEVWRVTLRRRSGVAATPAHWRGYVACAASSAPFVAAWVVTDARPEQVDPLFLVGYLCVLLFAAAVMAHVTQVRGMIELAATATVLVMAARVSPDVLGAQRNMTLLTFSIPPAAITVAWWIASLRPSPVGQAVALILARGAAISLAGSFVVVALAAGREPDPWVVTPFAFYALAHAAAMLAVGLSRASGRWLLGAQALALASLCTLATRYAPAALDTYAAFIGASMLVLFSLPVITPRARADLAGWISAAAAPLLHFALLYELARDVWSDGVLGIAALAIAALALALLRFAAARVAPAHTRDVTALLGALTLLFLSAAIPIALTREWITIVWGVEALALAWLYLRITHRGLLMGSALLATATVVRLVVNPSLWEYHPRSGAVVLNWYLYTFGIPAACMFAAAHLLRNDPTANGYRYPRALWFAGGVLAFVLLNVEIADAYSTGSTIGFHLGASVAEDMSYSLGWGVFALVTLVIGIRFGASKARVSALGVLLLAIAKVFLHDLWHLGALYRVGSMMGLAVALLAVSFLTQKYILRGDRS